MIVVHRHVPDGKAPPGSAVTIGLFDGVHLGHRKLLEETVKAAERRGGHAIVMTFHETPGKRNIPLIVPLRKRLELIEESGVDECLLVDGSSPLFSMSAGEFVRQVLHREIGAHTVIVGENWRFGRNKEGDVQTLRETAAQQGISVTVVPRVRKGGQIVSSSAIRKAVTEGKVQAAADMLGRPFSLEGTAEKGKGLGRRIGFPTINFHPEEGIIVPPPGVYATTTIVAGVRFLSATCVGENLLVETHLIDATMDNTEGTSLEVEFLDRIRPLVSFRSMEEMKALISRDVEEVRRRWKRREHSP